MDHLFIKQCDAGCQVRPTIFENVFPPAPPPERNRRRFGGRLLPAFGDREKRPGRTQTWQSRTWRVHERECGQPIEWFVLPHHAMGWPLSGELQASNSKRSGGNLTLADPLKK